MKSYLYYLKYKDKVLNWCDANYASDETNSRPLVVNCASCVNTPEQHKNANIIGRLDYYFIYLIEGVLSISTPIGKGVAKSGDVVIIPPKTKYIIDCTGETIYFLAVHFTGSEVLTKLSEYGLSLFPCINTLNAKNHMQIRFKKLFEGFSRNDSFRDNDLSCLLERILIEAARSNIGSSKNKVLLNKSINHINEFFNKSIKIPELAKMENMCMTNYNKTFKQIMGVSPTKYIINLRMNSAKELLEFTDLSIMEIGINCGYDDLNFFSKTFKANEGMTPSNYRKESRRYKILDFDNNPVVE